MEQTCKHDDLGTANVLADAKASFHRLEIGDRFVFLHKATNSLIPADNPLGLVISGLLSSDTDIPVSEEDLDSLLQQTSVLLSASTPSEASFHEVTDLSISPTLNCNLNCTYCYNYIEGPQSVIRKLPDLETDGIRNILKTLSKLPLSKTLRICFIGGEPFVDPVLLRHLLRICQRYCRRRGIVAYYFVTTNGINLRLPQVRRLISDFKINVSISFDGPRHWHNETRKLLDGRGSFRNRRHP